MIHALSQPLVKRNDAYPDVMENLFRKKLKKIFTDGVTDDTKVIMLRLPRFPQYAR